MVFTDVNTTYIYLQKEAGDSKHYRNKIMPKLSSAAVRTRRRLGNTSTYPYVRFDI